MYNQASFGIRSRGPGAARMVSEPTEVWRQVGSSKLLPFEWRQRKMFDDETERVFIFSYIALLIYYMVCKFNSDFFF